MSQLTPNIPVFSHGGTSRPGWPAVSGSVTGAGNPIWIGAAEVGIVPTPIAFGGVISLGTATVKIQANPGPADPQTGAPPSDLWVDIATISMDASTTPNFGKAIPVTFPYIRTNITAIAGGGVVKTFVPNPVGANASNPSRNSVQSES